MFRAYTSLHRQHFQIKDGAELDKWIQDRNKPGDVLFSEVALPALTPSVLAKINEPILKEE